MMAGKLVGRVALVTGGSRGIGAATARALAVEEATVIISYRSGQHLAEEVVREIQQNGGRAACVRSDQGDRTQPQALIDYVLVHFGRLDILVNNAAVFESAVVGDDADPSALDRLYATNQQGVIETIRAAAKVMGEGGRIITMSSNVVVRAGHTGFADYTASKAALTGYSKAAAWDLGRRGITCNIVQVGPTVTEMNPDDTELAAILKQWSALGRYGRPEEIAAAVVFLASPDASYITGTVLEVDGGINA